MSIADRVNALVDRVIEEERITGAVVLVYQDGDRSSRRLPVLPIAKRVCLPVSTRSSATPPSQSRRCRRDGAGHDREGADRLDDRVSDYLPWFRPKTPDGREGAITIRHLLTHTSGLLYDPRSNCCRKDSA